MTSNPKKKKPKRWRCSTVSLDELDLVRGVKDVVRQGRVQRITPEALVLEGKSEDEVLAANPLADYHDTWNWGFITTEKMTRTLYRSLSSL